MMNQRGTGTSAEQLVGFSMLSGAERHQGIFSASEGNSHFLYHRMPILMNEGSEAGSGPGSEAG